MGRRYEQHFTKEGIQVAHNHLNVLNGCGVIGSWESCVPAPFINIDNLCSFPHW